MTVAQEVRRRKSQAKANLEAEMARHNAQALCLAAIKLERINDWRREAMAFMTTDSFNNVHKHKRQYKRLRNAVIEAHSAWLDAYGLLEELEASKAYARAVYNLIQWSGLGQKILNKAPAHI